jgi:DNA-binding response OmpR family regulator
MSRILVVEDEAHLAKGLRFNLEAEGHAVEVCGDGEAAIMRLLVEKECFDAVVLDVMLPGKDGFAVATALRKAKNYVPVLMLTARGRPEDVLQGFAAGADDYLPKPFQLPIFLARLQGLLRRNEWLQRDELAVKKRASPEDTARGSRTAANGATRNSGAATSESPAYADADAFSFQGKTIDFNNLELRANDATIQLTLMEAKLLRHLIRNKGNPVSRKSILEDVWGLHEDTDTRAIDNFIVRLRRYIEKDPSKPRHLTTVRGVGYRFIP